METFFYSAVIMKYILTHSFDIIFIPSVHSCVTMLHMTFWILPKSIYQSYRTFLQLNNVFF